ncbi:MAG: SAM-dependent DNA methyltransferase [Lewinellaceae bacterium]|nr:SAM-dependent DNA methyltransferase [Lewinellaceae bacterium]
MKAAKADTIEQEYVGKASLEHRKKYAQFFTPQPIASLMARWVLGNRNIHTVLEPAFGLGIFSRAIFKYQEDVSIKGFEVDEQIFGEAETFFSGNPNITLSLQDYMLNDWENKYDGIICNPPYFKFHDYDNKVILNDIERHLNFKFSGFTNLYTLFLLKSIYQLSENGRAAYLIPSEFLNSDYGKPVKEYLLRSETLRHLFVIDFEENVFDDALTTACILFLAKDKNNSEINISTVKSKTDLASIEQYLTAYPNGKGELTFREEDLDSSVKWRRYYQPLNADAYKNLVPFSKYAKVVRGIATGANDYFTFCRSKARKYSIPDENLLPCICKAKDVHGTVFTEKDRRNLEENDELIYLFNAGDSTDKNVLRYLEIGEEKSVHERYLTRSRNPWYALENRRPAPIWVSVFNRSGLKFIRNEANISNLTTFHCVYPNKSDLFSTVNIDLLFAYLLTDVAKEIFSDNRREYGNGLKKFEPNDLNEAQMVDLDKLPSQIADAIIQLYSLYRKQQDPNIICEIDRIIRKEFSRA